MSAHGARRRSAAYLDLAFLCAVVTILAALAYPIGAHYVERARAEDVLRRYDSLRSELLQRLGDATPEACDEVGALVEDALMEDDRLVLGIGFAPVVLGEKRGFRPVFSVCGASGPKGALGVARAARRVFADAHRLESGGLVRDSLVSFAAPLGPPDHIVCRLPSQRLPRLCTGGP